MYCHRLLTAKQFDLFTPIRKAYNLYNLEIVCQYDVCQPKCKIIIEWSLTEDVIIGRSGCFYRIAEDVLMKCMNKC